MCCQTNQKKDGVEPHPFLSECGGPPWVRGLPTQEEEEEEEEEEGFICNGDSLPPLPRVEFIQKVSTNLSLSKQLFYFLR